MNHLRRSNGLVGAGLIVAASLLCCSVQDSSQWEATSARLQSPKGNKTIGCGTSNQMAVRIEHCAKPVMDILQGTVVNWPKVEADSQRLCEEIVESERCIKDEGRRCAKGLQKTIVSTLGSSITRSRKSECQAQKYGSILKTTKCLEKNSAACQNLIANVNNRLNVIDTQMKDLDKKTNAFCCVVIDIENELKALVKSICPVEGQMVVRLYRTVLDDVINLICRNPKCGGDLFRGYKVPRPSLTAYGGIVENLLKIVFTLDT